MLLQIGYKLKILVVPHTEFIFPSQDQKHQFSSEAVRRAETEREMKVNVFALKTGWISLFAWTQLRSS